MIIQEVNGQLVASLDAPFGEDMKVALLARGRKEIKEGTVLYALITFGGMRTPVLFEAAYTIVLQKVFQPSLMYPLPGSIVIPDPSMRLFSMRLFAKSGKGKNIFFRDCRLPSMSEYNEYLNATTV